jgi:hypothetical protein
MKEKTSVSTRTSRVLKKSGVRIVGRIAGG